MLPSPPPLPPPQQTSVTFIKFSLLPYYNHDETNERVIQLGYLIENTTDWKKVHQAIDIMRSLNKSYPEYVNQIVENYGSYILKFLHCTKKEISRNALALIQEVFMNGRITPLYQNAIEIFASAVSSIFDNTNKLSVKDCLFSLASNCIQDDTLIESCKITMQPHLISIGLNMIARFLQNIGSNFINLQDKTLNILMHCLQKSSQTHESQQQTNQIAIYIYNTIGDNSFTVLLENTLDENSKIAFVQSLQNYYFQFQQIRSPLSDSTNTYSQQENMTYNQPFKQQNMDAKNFNSSY